MKKAIVFGMMIVCIGLMYWFPHSTISPGELVEGHQNLNNKCFACHAAFKGISNEKCISCHKLSDIGKDSTKQSGSSEVNEKILFHKNLSGQKCTSCHTDHMGIHPPTSLSSFKHELLSLSVISNCNSCHNKPVDHLHSLLSSKCNDCHNTSSWKPEVDFDHSLIVATEKNNCASCHKSPDDSFHSSIKDNCDKCHTTEKWKPSSFDHSNYFVLDKDHNVECNTCHTNNNFKIYTCYGCHEHSESKIIDEHREEGISNITNCVSCHKSSDEDDIRMQDNGNSKINKNDYNKVREVIKKDKKDHNKKDDD